MTSISFRIIACAGLVVSTVLLSGCGSTGSTTKQDPWEQEQRMLKATIDGDFPAVPQAMDGLVVIEPTMFDSAFTYGVDPQSIVTSGFLVRYTLVSQSDAGVKNITLETLRCNSREFQINAVADLNGQWKKNTNPEWNPVLNTRNMAAQYVLYRGVLCAGEGVPGRDAQDLVERLKRWRSVVQ